MTGAQIISVLGILATVVIAIAGAYTVHFLTHNRSWREYRLRKLEELYAALHVHEVTIAEYYTRSAYFLNEPEDAKGLKEQEELLVPVRIALHEDEKKASIIPMIINIYFKDLLPAWQNFESAKQRLSTEHYRANMLNEDKRESLSRMEREAITKSVALAIVGQRLPELADFKNEMFTKITQAADDIKEERPWPFKDLFRDGRS